MKINETMKASSKMMQGISKVEKKWGALEKDFFVEQDESIRVGNGFYDGCGLYSKSLYGGQYIAIVAHDGSISYR